VKPPILRTTFRAYLEPVLSEARQVLHSTKRKPIPGMNAAALQRWIEETEILLAEKPIAELEIDVPLVPGLKHRADPEGANGW
jgi:hypothetical protein